MKPKRVREWKKDFEKTKSTKSNRQRLDRDGRSCIYENLEEDLPSQHFNVGSTLFQRCGSTLKMKQNPTSDFQRCTTLIQRRCATLKQRWYNFISTLFQLGLNNSKSYIKTSRASDKYRFAKSLSKFYSANYFELYINNSTTNKLVNFYSNFLTVHVGCKGENGEAQKSSKL